MVTLSEEERELLDVLQYCLASAARNKDLNPDYTNETKIQKLLFLPIEEFGIPVTYSWYLAGTHVDSANVSLSNVETAFNQIETTETTDTTVNASLGGTESHEVESTSVVTEDETDDILNLRWEYGSDYEITDELTVRRCIRFYERKADDVWYTPYFDFLEEFYSDYAPPEYRELYLRTIDLRRILDNTAEEIVNRIDESDQGQSRLALFGSGASTGPDHYREIGLVISDLHTELRQIDELEETFDLFVECTNLIEDAYMMLAQLDVDDLEESHIEAFDHLSSFYLNWAWQYPCLYISKETATGPSEDKIRTEREHRLEMFDVLLKRQLNLAAEVVDHAGLLPEYTDFPDLVETDLEKSISKLTKEYTSN